MIAALSVLVVAVAISAKASFVAPVASGYIYRNDNHGPPSLIQLGPIPYQQPHTFAPALPLSQPLAQTLVQPVKHQAFEVYDLAAEPLPLPYIASQPIIDEETENDDDESSEESSEEYLDGSDHHGNSEHAHGHAHEKGAGSEYSENHHEAHGEKGSKGFNSKGHHESGKSGHYGKKHHEGHYGENEGEEKSHHDKAVAHGKHYKSGKGYKGGNHGHKKHFNKGEDVTGYHKIFHKDEFKKDHDFYDVADNSGHFKKYENDHKKHGSKIGSRKEGGHHNSAYDKGAFGKAGSHAKGEIKESEEGHSAEEGYDSHHNHEEDYGKEGGKEHEKEYSYEEEEDDD